MSNISLLILLLWTTHFQSLIVRVCLASAHCSFRFLMPDVSFAIAAHLPSGSARRAFWDTFLTTVIKSGYLNYCRFCAAQNHLTTLSSLTNKACSTTELLLTECLLPFSPHNCVYIVETVYKSHCDQIVLILMFEKNWSSRPTSDFMHCAPSAWVAEWLHTLMFCCCVFGNEVWIRWNKMNCHCKMYSNLNVFCTLIIAECIIAVNKH